MSPPGADVPEFPSPEASSPVVTVLAVDPGRAKCGLAIVSHPPLTMIERAVIASDQLVVAVSVRLRARPEITRFLMGSGTNGAVLRKALHAALPAIPIVVVEEHGTSQRARARYCSDHAARGWRRLLPPGLRLPEEPYDDYAALLLAEDYFAAQDAVRQKSG